MEDAFETFRQVKQRLDERFLLMAIGFWDTRPVLRSVYQSRSRLTAFERQRDADRRQSDEEAVRHADDRRRLEERAAASERRLMAEIDRERQEAKQAKSALSEAERRSEVARQRLEVANKTLGDKLQETEAELRSVRQALASANERSSELHTKLDEQGAASTAALNQLTLLVANQAHKTPAAAPTRRGRIK